MSITFTTKGADVAGCELNVASGNFAAVMTLCGWQLHEHGTLVYEGQLALHQIPGIIMGCTLALSDPSDLVDAGHRERNVIYCGRSPEQVRRYALQMLKLCSLALANKEPIVWY